MYKNVPMKHLQQQFFDLCDIFGTSFQNITEGLKNIL